MCARPSSTSSGTGRDPERLLADKLAALMEKHGVGIPAGRSAKALSAWKTGRQLPQDARLLIILRKIVHCTCGGYTDTDLYRLLRATKQVGERSPASTAPKSRRPPRTWRRCRTSRPPRCVNERQRSP